jgi:O-antigen ligase
VLAVAFLHGWADFGITAWALTNRLAGWFILLAYLATGALIVNRGGDAGFSMLLRTYAATALAIIALEMIAFAMLRIGVPIPRAVIAARLVGFAQNPNAFALQIVLAIAVLIVAIKRPRIQTLALGVALIGLWFSGSRAGMIALAVVVLAALALRFLKLSRLAGAVVLTLAAVFVVNLLPEIALAAVGAVRWTIASAYSVAMAVVDLFSTSPSAPGEPWAGPALVLQPPRLSAAEVVALGYEPSNLQRIASLKGGFEMFMSSPIFGAGLGAFIHEYARAHGVALVIHSTPLWLLAELGVIGLLAFAAPFIRALKYETRGPARHDPVGTFIILALLAFGAVAAVHDMMYQRAFWLLIGAAFAVPVLGAKQRPQPS